MHNFSADFFSILVLAPTATRASGRLTRRDLASNIEHWNEEKASKPLVAPAALSYPGAQVGQQVMQRQKNKFPVNRTPTSPSAGDSISAKPM